MRYNVKRKIKVGAFLMLLPFIVLGCEFIIDRYFIYNDAGEEVNYVKAGEVATFKFEGHISIDGDASAEDFIVAFLVPRNWNARENAKVTYTEDKFEDSSMEQPMTAIPVNDQPQGKGMSWDAVLKEKYGVGANVLNDMEWVAFRSKNYPTINGRINYTVTIKCRASMNNQRFRPAFFINHSSDGLGGDAAHFACYGDDPGETECFEVVEGQGSIIDFCSMHYYQVEPLSSLQDDFVTFTFQGDVVPDNELASADKVFLEAVAHTVEGNVYTVNEKSAKTLMVKEEKMSRYNLTVWPVEFFGILEGETISYIEYVFSNKDGTVKVTRSDDDRDNAGEEVEEGAQEPFVFELRCD